MAESKEELKSLFMKVKEESPKAGFKLNIQKMKIMASGPITLWQIDGETMETGTDFIFGAPKSLQMVNAAIKLSLLLGRKATINLDSILKSRDISPLRIMFAVGLSYIAFIMLRYVPSIPAFWRVFIINGC